MLGYKRGKMLVLTLLLTISVLIRQTTCINLTYIVKKEGEKLHPSCIADENERYAAIGWVYPIPETEENLPDITTKFIPKIQNTYNCKFSKNDKCNNIWMLKNWEIDKNTTRTLDLIFDSRWEDIPVIFTGNKSKEFKDRVEIPSIFRAGFSVRASDNVELLICEGWDPYNHPCYHLSINKTKAFLRKYTTLSKVIYSSDKLLDSYEGFVNILSGDEWRNFVVNLDDEGVLSLYDISLNRTVIQYQDKEVLKPLYLLVRSTQPTLWKIHQNQFIYTKTAQISRLGPTLNLPSKDLCVSLYVSTCENCAITFFIIGNNNQKQILKDIGPTQESEWQMVKLKAPDQIMTDKVSIFVETKFIDKKTGSDGFWAIDDVRICHENEVKVTFLNLKEKNESADDISCQVVQHPKWRPKRLVYPKITDFPTIQSSPNSTSISLNWTQEDPNNQINYFITYQANDLCYAEPFNLRRIKSNGFLMTKFNEITIEDLIPYTKYNISFSSMLHENEKNISVTTLATEMPTAEEIPNGLQIQTTDTEAFISWHKVDCTSLYGPIFYSMQVTNLDTNMLQDLEIQTKNVVQITDLKPFSPYTFHIVTARNSTNIQKYQTTAMSLNFTTRAAVAPPIRNVEVYSVDKNSVSIRYDLPKKPSGVPTYLQMIRCNPITYKKCRSVFQPITRCKLWPKKYCLNIDDLIPNQKYTFRISIKNDGSKYYGEEVKVNTFTAERIPAPPTNITYQIVDCQNGVVDCNLNITWLHPYGQNGTITSFNIVLNGTDNSTSDSIHGVLKVSNKTYLPKYNHQIMYVPYSTHYELYVQSVGPLYKSDFAHVHVKTADIGDHINQQPTLVESKPTSVTFKLPTLDPRLTSYNLTTVVQNFNSREEVPRQVLRMKKVADNLCHDFGDTWILPTVEITNSSATRNVIIGTEDPTNKYLKPSTQYCVTFIITNKYKNTEHDVVYIQKLTTPRATADDSKNKKAKTSGATRYNHLYMLALLLLLLPIGFLVYRCVKKRRAAPKQQENRENVYESLPFEECEDNSVSNETYDQLLHK